MGSCRIFAAWLLSAALTSPYSYYLTYSKKYKTCVLHWTAEEQLIFAGLFATFTNILPITIVVVIRAYSVMELRKAVTSEYTTAFTERRKKQVRHITNMFSIITGTFFVLTVPYMGLYVKMAYNKRYNIPPENYYYYLHYGLYFMSCLNFIVNPYLYAQHMGVRKWLRTIVDMIRCYTAEGHRTGRREAIRKRNFIMSEMDNVPLKNFASRSVLHDNSKTEL